MNTHLAIDADFSGGNIVVEKVRGTDVYLHQDLRDTEGDWFYWCFRIRGAENSTLTFHFTGSDVLGVRGPAISRDGGDTWHWLGRDCVASQSFTYTFSAHEREIKFGMTMAYTQAHLDKYLRKPSSCPQADVLCTSRKGRDVEVLRFGCIDRTPLYRALITARNHACESMASYTLEGLAEFALGNSAGGEWFRDYVECVAVPFMDKDGVEDGDQGKNRIPRDHNRDFDKKPIYPEVRGLKQYTKRWINGVPSVLLDLHCPYIRGGTHDRIYQVGHPDTAVWRKQERFGVLLESKTAGHTGSIPYRCADNLPFGEGWNTAENYSTGVTCSTWFLSLPDAIFSSCIEIPYAEALGAEVNQLSARLFGHDVAEALMGYLIDRPSV